MDPRQPAPAPGRPPSDAPGCPWIRRLHRSGLWTGAFRPAGAVVRRRGFQRQRALRIRYAAQHGQHRQKGPEERHVQRAEVVRARAGGTGREVLRDIGRGVRDPVPRAQHRHDRCRAAAAPSAAALGGPGRPELRLALRQAPALYEFYQKQLQGCAVRSEECRRARGDHSRGAPRPPRPRPRRQPAKDGVRCGARALWFPRAGVDRTPSEGVSAATALGTLSEPGVDRSAFPHAKDCVSGLGRCPQRRGRGGQVGERRALRGAKRVARAWRRAARGCHHAQDAPGASDRRIRSRCGGAKAVAAAARQPAERVDRLRRYGPGDVRQSQEASERAYPWRQVQSLSQKAASPGYGPVPAPAAPGPYPPRAARPRRRGPTVARPTRVPPGAGEGAVVACPGKTG